MTGPMQDLGGVVLVAALIAAAIVVLLTAQVSHARAARRLRSRITAVQARAGSSELPADVQSVRLSENSSHPFLNPLLARSFRALPCCASGSIRPVSTSGSDNMH